MSTSPISAMHGPWAWSEAWVISVQCACVEESALGPQGRHVASCGLCHKLDGVCVRYLHNVRTWGESLPESSHGLGKPRQDLRVVRPQVLNDALNGIGLTSGYAGEPDNAPMEVWGQRRRWRGGEGPKPKCAVCGLWVGPEASVRDIRYQCNARTWGSLSRCHHTVWASLDKIFGL